MIRSDTHADIGSDHGLMLYSMLKSGRIDRGIAVEDKQQPFQNSVKTLSGLNAEVRFGDGLAAIKSGEANSLSICGMGGSHMRDLLLRFPDRIPPQLILQPNNRLAVIRQWAFESGFHLVEEVNTAGSRIFTVFNFRRAIDNHCVDPAYANLDRQASFEFGPWNLRRREPEFIRQLADEKRYWEQFSQLEPKQKKRLGMIRAILDDA